MQNTIPLAYPVHQKGAKHTLVCNSYYFCSYLLKQINLRFISCVSFHKNIVGFKIILNMHKKFFLNYGLLAFNLLQEIWEKASEYPLIGLLPPDQASYHFCCIKVSSGSETVELMEESLCLREINMFMNVLKVVKRNIGQEDETRLNNNISCLIGKGTIYLY